MPRNPLVAYVIWVVWGLCTAATPLSAADWPAWRGPRGDGVSSEAGIPIRWSNAENVYWKVPIAGKGHSSPVICGDRIFVTTCLEKDGKRLLLCLDRKTGKSIWEREVVAAPLEGKHKLNSYASSTPATDGTHVYVSFYAKPNMEVACFDFDGNKVWQKSPGTFQSVHGFCSSPVLYNDKVIVNGDQDAEAWIVALDKKSGAERWRVDRPNRTRSYCVPIIVDAAGKKQLVLSGSKCVTSYDPDSGKLHWIIDGPTEQYVASLVYLEGVFFLTCGFPEYHVMGIRPDGEGNITKSHVLWHHAKNGARNTSYVPSPIAYDQWFYLISDQGYVSCYEAKSGNRLWIEKLGMHHSASAILADGHIYLVDDEGTTFVLKVGPKFHVVAKNKLPDEEVSASPAISHGQIFIRKLHHLYCIGKAKETTARPQ